MAKRLSWGILFLALILSLVMTSCSALSSILPNSNTPSGTYSATAMGFTATITFGGNNTLTTYDEFDGKYVFTYSISSDGQSIRLTNVVTNQTDTEPFEYIKAQKCVVFEGTSYFK